jgi:dTDP-4-dehydrorhamnose 3,5-epimerase
MAFRFKKLRIPDVVLIEPELHADERGFFTEIHKASEFEENKVPCRFVQSSYSRSRKGVLRGLHYQAEPMAQGKLVRVVSGRIFDVAVDLRKNSRSFARWVGAELSEENGDMLWVPEGFAHGFLALEDDTRVLYQFTREYSKEHSRGIVWNDPGIKIEWPVKDPILSEKDRALPGLSSAVAEGSKTHTRKE